MQHSVTLALYEYWIGLKGQRYAPLRSEIEPSSIRSLLSSTFILETDLLEGCHFRLAGTDTCALLGRDLKQSDFLEIWNEHGQEALDSGLRILRDNSACIFATWEGRTARYHETSGELLMLPLMHEGKINRVLGSFTAFETPYWQGTFPLVKINLNDIKVILPTEHGLPLFKDTDSPPPLVASAILKQEGRRVGHLTVFEGGQKDL